MSHKFLPATFERRGVFLNFNRKILRFARLRIDDPEDRNRWNVVLPYHGSARRGAVAVIPWLQIPQFTDMSSRDEGIVRLLCKLRIPRPGADPAIDPLMMRAVQLTIDSEYGETPERQAEAKREQAMDAMIRSTVHLHLFANLVHEFARDVEDDVLTNMTGGLYRQLSAVARKDANLKVMLDRFGAKVVEHAARKLNLTPDHVTRRMDDMAEMIVPLGKVDMEDIAAANAAGESPEERTQDGFLIRGRDNLRWLHTEMEVALMKARSELQYPLEMVLFSIDQFLKTASSPIDDVERDIARIATAIQRYDLLRPRLMAARLAVAWALDGWSAMVKVWHDTLYRVAKNDLTADGKMHVADVIELEKAITTIFQNMPSMPTSEVNAIRTRLEAWDHFESTRAKVVQAGCDWSNNRPDEDLRRRIAVARPG